MSDDTAAETEASVQALNQAAKLFHEILAAYSSEDLLTRCRNEIVAIRLREQLRTSAQLRTIAFEGFELCVRALAQLGADGVMIHACGAQDMEPWVEL